MTWTQFHDMHSGGDQKLDWGHIFIEADEERARVVFQERFGRDPDNVTCDCCGADYSVTECKYTLAQATGYERGCRPLETPRDPNTRRFLPVEDPWFHEHYYLEKGEEPRAPYTAEPEKSWHKYRTLDEYLKSGEALVITAEEISATAVKAVMVRE
jgi:hypothetical protein